MHEASLKQYRQWRRRAISEILGESTGNRVPILVSHGRYPLDEPYPAGIVLPIDHNEDLSGLQTLPQIHSGDRNSGDPIHLHSANGRVFPAAVHRDMDTGRSRIVSSPGGRLNGFYLAGHKSDTDYRDHTRKQRKLGDAQRELAEMTAHSRIMQAQDEADRLRSSGVLVPETHLLAMTSPQARDYAQAIFHHSRLMRSHADDGVLDTDAISALAPGLLHPDIDVGSQAQGIVQQLPALKTQALRRISNAHSEGAKIAFIKRFADANKGDGIVIHTGSEEAIPQIEHALREAGHGVAILHPEQFPQERAHNLSAFNPLDVKPLADILIHHNGVPLDAVLNRRYHVINHDAPFTPAAIDPNALSQHDLLLDNNHERVQGGSPVTTGKAIYYAKEPQLKAQEKAVYAGSAPQSGEEPDPPRDTGDGEGDVSRGVGEPGGTAYRRTETPVGKALLDRMNDLTGNASYPIGNCWLHETGAFSKDLKGAGVTHALSSHFVLKREGLAEGPPRPASKNVYMNLTGSIRIIAYPGQGFNVELRTPPTPEQESEIRRYAGRNREFYFDMVNPITESMVASGKGLEEYQQALDHFKKVTQQ